MMNNVLAGVVDRVVGPAVRRVGSVLAGVLVTAGMTVDAATQVEMALVALGAFGVDLVMSNVGVLKRGSR